MCSVNRILFRVATYAAAFVFAGIQVSTAQPTLTDLTPPGATSSSIQDINQDGLMAGSRTFEGTDAEGNPVAYTSAVVWNRFGVATILDPANTFSNYSRAYFINSIGEVAGIFGPWPGRPFHWSSSSGMTDLGFLTTAGVPDSLPYMVGIADNGWVVGTSRFPSGQQRTWLYRNGALEELIGPTGGTVSAFFITPDARILVRSFANNTIQLWNNGVYTAITMPGEPYRAYGMNNSGDIVLSAAGRDILLRHPDGMRTALRAAGPPYPDPGTGQLLFPRYYGALNVWVAGIDELGRVYGYTEMPPAEPGTPSTSLLWCWSDGAFSDVVVPGDLFSGENPVLFDNLGHMVATYGLGGAFTPILWCVGDPFVTPLPMGDSPSMSAVGMNDAGQIIGYGDTPAGPTHAFAWGLPPRSALDVSAPVVAVRNKKVVTVTVTITNPSAETVYDVVVLASYLDGTPTNSLLPLNFGAIKPGASKKCTVQFKNVGSGELAFTLDGTCSAGPIFAEQLIQVP